MFIYTIVNEGSEKLLKEEMKIKYPEFSFAYSRPGYLTFKDNSQNFNLDIELDLIFARSYGISVGKLSKENLEEEIKQHKFQKLHKFSLVTGEYSGEVAKIGEVVLDIIEIKEGEIWGGLRKVKRYSWKTPGGSPHLNLPENSPSRAYLKIAEALIWTEYDYEKSFKAGWRECENVLELGSSPGGASYAMLERGFKVFGVDNALMDEMVLKNKKFVHLKKPMQSVLEKEIPRPCHLLVSDVNVLPSLILGQIKRFLALRPSIHSVYYTLKIGDKISIKEVLTHIETFKSFGFSLVKTTQLPSNRSEILLYGVREVKKKS